MDFNRSLIFAYLEEDNIQRAYFRVRPLLTLDGDVREEAAQLWPNEGALRIVPDRNEQHTFKSRMRTLGAYCVVDLRNQPTEAGKIRTNKNYRPDKGEINQYILYSDTVHELPEDTFYHLLDGTAGEFTAAAEQAITPLFFIREGDTLYGPVRKNAPEAPQPAHEAAGMLYELPCPDGITRMMLCIADTPASRKPEAPVVKAEPAPVPVEASAPAADTPPEPVPEKENVSAEALPIGESLQILDQEKSHEDTLKQLDLPVSSGANLLRQPQASTVVQSIAPPKQGSLSGTPLVRTPLHVSVQQTKNRTQEVVSSQWNVGKYEPPAQNLPASTTMRAVVNPVEAACMHLKDAWNVASAHDQLADFILSLDGAQAQLEAKLCKDGSMTLMQRVLQDRLQDLEAERLTALCELDKAHRDVDAYKQELLKGLSNRIAQETGALEQTRKTAEEQVAALKAQINSLTLQRDALLARVNELQSDMLPEAVARLMADAQMAAPVNGIPLRMTPVAGKETSLDEMIARISAVGSAAGIEISRNSAIAVLVLLAISPRIGISSATPAAAATLARNIAAALGWRDSYAHQISAEQRPVCGIRPVDGTPALLMTSLPNYAPLKGVAKLTLNRSAANLIRNAAYDASQWPVLMLPALPFVQELEAPDAQPVSATSLNSLAEKNHVSNAELDTVLGPILQAAIPLSGTARKELYRFVSVCAGMMEGGLPAAADWGILLWIVPALERGSKYYSAVKPLLDEYPLSLRWL